MLGTQAAAKEQDSDRLLELVRQINQMLEDKERRLQGKAKAKTAPLEGTLNICYRRSPT